jgi:hypothetical protein
MQGPAAGGHVLAVLASITVAGMACLGVGALLDARGSSKEPDHAPAPAARALMFLGATLVLVGVLGIAFAA